MSQQNVEFVLDGYARFNARGERLATLVPEFYAADAEYHVAREDPDSAVHRGVAAITKQIEGWIDAYPDLKLETSDARANGEQVFVWVRFVGQGAGSGLPVEMELAHVITLRDGKVARLDEYSNRAEALEAMGLAA
jgi:ketosteroid isomerase-like protein